MRATSAIGNPGPGTGVLWIAGEGAGRCGPILEGVPVRTG